ncbi:MAG TPA: hypothetical protein VF519_02950 [Mycobacteriales bacterium]
MKRVALALAVVTAGTVFTAPASAVCVKDPWTPRYLFCLTSSARS